MDSRAKFEEWLHKPIDEGADVTAWITNDLDEIAWQAWKAGRESMRQEAAIACGNESLFDVYAGNYSSACLACGERITEIEP